MAVVLMGFNSFLRWTDSIIPHDILAGLLVVALAGYMLVTGYSQLATVGIALLGIAIAVDLAAHGWTH